MAQSPALRGILVAAGDYSVFIRRRKPIITNVYQQLLARTQMTGATVTQLLGSNPFSMDEVWHTMGYVFSLVVVIPALLVIMFIRNEFSYRTYKQNIINGWSRDQALTAKLLGVVALSVLITALYVVGCLIVAGALSEDDMTSGAKLYFIGMFLLQTFAQLSLAFMLGYFLRRSFLALMVFLFWPVVLEPILSHLLSRVYPPAAHFLPFEISDRLIPPPAFSSKMDPERYAAAMAGIGPHVAYALIFTGLLWLLCYRVNQTRNL